MIVELNRRLVKGYTTYKDDPRIISLKKSVLAYNKELMLLNIRDHQISYAKFSISKVVFTLLYRLAKLSVLTTAVLPGTVLFAPVFIAGKSISIKKSREALAASTVKIQARDVMATWKLLVSMALAPVLYTWYTAILTYWTYRNRINGLIPDGVPLIAIVAFGYIFFPAITFMALRFGEVGMDIAKSMRPLILSLSPSSSNTMVRLREKRERLVEQVTEVINALGPELYPDFDHQRIITDPGHPLSPNGSRPQTPRSTRANSYNFALSPISPTDTATPPWIHAPAHRAAPGSASSTSSSSSKNFNTNTLHAPQPRHPFNSSGTAGAGIGGGSGAGSAHLPRNESFANIGHIGIFATRPGTPNRSRSRNRSDGGIGSFSFYPGGPNGGLRRAGSGNAAAFAGEMGMTRLSNLGPGASGSGADMEEVSKKIRGAMRERGRRRRDSEEGETGDRLENGVAMYGDDDDDGVEEEEEEERRGRTRQAGRGGVIVEPGWEMADKDIEGEVQDSNPTGGERKKNI